MRRAILARLHVMLCQIFAAVSGNELCAQIVLIHLPGSSTETTTTLWAVILSSGTAQNPVDQRWTNVGGVRSTIQGGKFEFALQTGFSGNVAPGDVVQFGGEDQVIMQVRSDQLGVTYVADCTTKKARQLGAA